MITLQLSPEYFAEPSAVATYEHGRIYHFARNSSGRGGVYTPVASFHVWQPEIGTEGFHRHQRVDCYVRDAHELAPDPAWLARALLAALLRNSTVHAPVWLGWHKSQEIGGEPLGDVFDFN